MGKSVAEIVTEKIIQQLEKGVVPWRRPWTGLAVNWVTQKEYQGINTLLLPGGEYATMNQIKAAKGRVKKEELKNSYIVCFYKNSIVTTEEEEDGEENHKVLKFLRYYRVWEINTQCTGLKSKQKNKQQLPSKELVPRCQNLIEQYIHRPVITHGGTQAYYNRINDVINIPNLDNFYSIEGYYQTLFHELIHSTGHPSRLNRDTLNKSNKFADEQYSKEELVAEIGASILCAHAQISNDLQQSASYIQSWIRALRGDARLVFKASAEAQRAAQYLLENQSQPKSVG